MILRGRKSLRRRFILTLLGVVSLILTIFSGLVIGYNYQQKEAELQRQLQQTLLLAETALPEAVWSGKQQSIRDILKAILANDTVVCARILGGAQLVISERKPTHQNTLFSEFENSSGYLINSADIFRQGILIGKLQLVMSRVEIHSEIFRTAFSVISLFVMLVFAILFTSMLVLRHYFFRPLAKLQRSAQLIANGNLDTPIDIDSSDEIGKLASAFRLMANHLEESFETLEHKVIERTVDLSKAKITAEKNSQSLLLLGAELQALLDNSPVGILFADNDRVIQRVNTELENITGYSSVELVGQSTTVLYGQEDQGLADSAKIFPELTDKGHCEGRACLVRKDGAEITCWLRGRSIQVSSDLEGIIWSVENITSRIFMEQELLRAKKRESIGVLAGGIGHDFNNILFAVIGNLSLAERFAEKGSAVAEHIRAAQKASVRAKELTAKLLTFASGGEPVKQTASLPELVQEATELVLAGSNVRCSFSTPEDLWPVSMDKMQISQVIQDLVRNANQSMPEGGTISITFTNKRLNQDDVAGLAPGRYVRVHLTDKGSGIGGEDLERVFDPYFSTREKDSSKGRGLGLAIVHSIVSRHEGKISVQSTPGFGTTFVLYLPARATDPGLQAGSPAVVPSGKGLVLVQDCDSGSQEMIRDMLQAIGYKAQLVYDGKDAVDQFKNSFQVGGGFSAVIMSRDNPGVTAWEEVLAMLVEIDPKVKVIVSVESENDPMLWQYQDYGFYAAVKKPFSLLEVNRILSSLSGPDPNRAALWQDTSSLKN